MNLSARASDSLGGPPASSDPPVPGLPVSPSEYQVQWRLNERCNFRCAYCFREGRDQHRADEHPDCGKYSPEHIARSFDATGKTWRIRLTGGEPFLYPGFIALAQALTRRHRLAVNTNLSAPAVRDFAERVAPARVHSINATLHFHEVEKRGLMARWFETFLYFQEKGFNIRLVCLTHPLLLGRLASDLEHFRAQGVARTYVKIFRGPWNGSHYPGAFTAEERRLIQKAGLTEDEQRILDGRVYFLSLYCGAGCIAFDMDVRGILTRCSGVKTPHGNLFEGQFNPDTQPRPCPVLTCACPYQGMCFAEKANLEVHADRSADGSLAVSVRRCEPGPSSASETASMLRRPV
jgi:MoaA/NifB/PqqE/SkfB family radical SAM enzyme